MENQIQKQMIVAPGTAFNPNRITERAALFNPDGSPFSSVFWTPLPDLPSMTPPVNEPS